MEAPANPLLSDTPQDWERLIESAGPASLLVVIESRLGSELARHTTAEDVLQDALLLAWRDRASCQWRGPRSFRCWLLTIIDHRIRDLADYFTAKKRGGGGRHAPVAERGFLRQSLGSEALAVTTTPSRVAAYREQAHAMRVALSALEPVLREVVQLRLFDQMTLEQAAERLGIGVSAARYRFARGVEVYQGLLGTLLGTKDGGQSIKQSAARSAASDPDAAS